MKIGVSVPNIGPATPLPVPWPRCLERLRQMAEAVGRDPSGLKMIVRTNLYLTDKPIEKDRGLFAGSMEQVREGLAA